jgi:hypothetical protein
MNMELVCDISIHQGMILTVPVLTTEGTACGDTHNINPRQWRLKSFKTVDKNSILAQMMCGGFIYMAAMKASCH